MISPNFDQLINSKTTCPSNIQFIWLGHSTVLVRFFDQLILFDPLFFAAAPVPFLIRRFFPSPTTPQQIPQVDWIVLSHDHYDHMDAKALRGLLHQRARFLVPLGLKSRLIRLGFNPEKITELDWWQNFESNDFKFTLTPTQHFSGRSLWDGNKTLWGSWCVHHQNSALFFSGDSGYNSHFKEIGERLGPFDLTMIEAGQYNPLWTAVHMLPEESVQAHLDLKGKVMLPIHWGAYSLSTHAWYDPAERTFELSKKMNSKIIIPKQGELVQDLFSYSTNKWWAK